jgi:hypothetical protein
MFSEQLGCCVVASLGCNTTTRVSPQCCIYIVVPYALTTLLRNLLCAISLHLVIVMLIGSTLLK